VDLRAWRQTRRAVSNCTFLAHESVIDAKQQTRHDMKKVKHREHKPSERIKDNWIYKIKEAVLRFLGDVKLFKAQARLFVVPHVLTTPIFRTTVLHDPSSYQVKGVDMRRAMSEIQPGDILVRGFDNYVDGNFIPGFFSHAGLYLGRVDKDTLERHWARHFAGCAPHEEDYAPLKEVLENVLCGEQMVIHSMKDGIFMEDLLNFCRCDYMTAVSFPTSVRRAPDVVRPYSENEQIKKAFTVEERRIAQQLEQNSTVPYSEIFPVVFKLALSQLGTKYDFGLDFSSFKKMSCTEFVYYCTKSLEWCHNVRPVTETVMFVKAPGISPDGFVGATSPSRTVGLKKSFASDSVDRLNVIPAIQARYPGPYGDFSR
jgi:hypothetical protein